MKALTLIKLLAGMAMAGLLLPSCQESLEKSELSQPSLLSWEADRPPTEIITDDWLELDDLALPPGSRLQIKDPHSVEFSLPAGWQFVSVQDDQSVSMLTGTSGRAKCSCEQTSGSAGVKCTVNYNTQNGKVFCKTGPACKSCKLTVVSSERKRGTLFPVALHQDVHFSEKGKKGILQKCFPEVLLEGSFTEKALRIFERRVYGKHLPTDMFDSSGKLTSAYQWAPIELLGYQALFALPKSKEMPTEQEPPNGGNAHCKCEGSSMGEPSPGFCFRLSRPGSPHLVTCSSHNCDENCWVVW